MSRAELERVATEVKEEALTAGARGQRRTYVGLPWGKPAPAAPLPYSWHSCVGCGLVLSIEHFTRVCIWANGAGGRAAGGRRARAVAPLAACGCSPPLACPRPVGRARAHDCQRVLAAASARAPRVLPAAGSFCPPTCQAP